MACPPAPLYWPHPLTERHLRQLAADGGCSVIPDQLELPELVEWMNCHCPRLHIVPPQNKRLACGDVGMGALAELTDLVAAVSLMANGGS